MCSVDYLRIMTSSYKGKNRELLYFLYFLKFSFQAFGKWMETFNYDFSIHKTAKVIGMVNKYLGVLNPFNPNIFLFRDESCPVISSHIHCCLLRGGRHAVFELFDSSRGVSLICGFKEPENKF